ncbi:unnamed protein product [Ceutorhynchus assimilis]|uniref:Uncharacterized protein n=1 Tax=Ceutorhynchus assimilis TaxID=467358 RepID=A0A9N9QQM5_9CUCU|nr:unnamed protein product [Ceutorhynchus assimilis]
MSKKPTPKLLTPGEISKKIMLKPKKIYTKEWLDKDGLNRDQRLALYNEKKNKFLDCAKAYNRMNVETSMCPKVQLNSDYESRLNLDFLKEKEPVEEDCDSFCCCPNRIPGAGRVLRRRTLRHIEEVEEPTVKICSTEAWFKRHLILNKFIWAARTVIIQNRLQKVLDKFRGLTLKDIRAIEETMSEKTCEEYHCHPVFLKFL